MATSSWTLAAAVAAVSGAAGSALADADARSYNHSAAATLTPFGGGTINWAAAPSGLYLHAQAYADHSDTPGAAFNESFLAAGVAAASEPTLASVSGVLADPGSLTQLVQIAEAHSFAHRVPPSTAVADGLSEIERLFTVSFATPPPSFFLGLSVLGSASLSGSCLSDENWQASYQVHIQIYDAQAPGTPILFDQTQFNSLAGPGASSLTDPIAISGSVPSLLPDHTYGVYLSFDAETSAIAPSPGAAGILVLAGLAGVGRRSRRRPVA